MWMKILQARLSITAAVLAAAFMCSRASAMEIYLTPDDETDFAYLILNGVIKKDDHKRIEKDLRRIIDRGVAVAILLTSPGGGLEETPEIARVIVKASNTLFKKNKRKIVIGINEECSSACTVLTADITNSCDPKALEFVVFKTARFGFHSPVDYVNKKTSPIKDVKLRDELIAKQISYYIKAGTNSKWLTANAEMFKKAEMTDLTAEKLCKDESRIIPKDSCIDDSVDITTAILPRIGKLRPNFDPDKP